MNTILVKEVFVFLVTVVVSEFELCNGQATKEAEMVVVTFCSVLIFFQSNDVSAVFDVVRELAWFSKWISGHDEMNAKTYNTFNDPLSVGALIFKV